MTRERLPILFASILVITGLAGGQPTLENLTLEGNAGIAIQALAAAPGGSLAFGGKNRAWVGKLAVSGQQGYRVWLGEKPGDSINALAADASGNVYVAGSLGEPEQAGFVAVLDPDGRVQGRYPVRLAVEAIAVDRLGAIYAASGPEILKLRFQKGAWETIWKAATAGPVHGLAVDADGFVYVAGSKNLPGGSRAFVGKLAGEGTRWAYTFELAGNGGHDHARALAVAADGSVYFTGATDSNNLLGQGRLSGTEDAFVARLAPDGSTLQWFAYLGGSGLDEGRAVALDARGQVWVGGWTESADFPGAIASRWAGARDGFVAAFDVTGRGMGSAYWGTAGQDGLEALAVTPEGAVYAGGSSDLAQIEGGLLRVSALAGVISEDLATAGIALKSGGVRSSEATGLAGGFAPAADYPVGSHPVSVAAKDLNGDGIQDLVVVNHDSNTVSVLLGQADGTFTPKVDYGVGSSPNSVVVGDFDGDGHWDLAVVNDGGANTASVLKGKGDGTFGAQTQYPVGTNPYYVAAADLNGDKKADLVVANWGANSVSVLLGKGDGTFQPKADYATGSHPTSLALADINSDGFVDVVTTNESGGTVSVLLGKGDGTLQPKADTPAGTNPHSVAVADFDTDGNTDLAVASWGSNAIVVLWGKGDGTFPNLSSYGTGSAPYAVAIGDLNGDGRDDLFATNYTGNSLSVLIRDANGAFRAHTDYTTGNGPYGFAIADFNRDGLSDVAVANSGGASVSILMAAPVAAVAPVQGTPQRGLLNTVFPVALQVRVTDANGQPAASANVTFTAPTSGPGGTFEGGAGSVQVQADALGLAAAPVFTANGAPGNYKVLASTGDLSGVFALTNVAANATVTLAASENPSTLGQKVALTASVSPATATGRVAFYDGGTLLGTAPVNAGKAVLPTWSLPAGRRILQARYQGDPVWTPAASAMVPQTVSARPFVVPGPTQSYRTLGQSPYWAVGDLNGDGRPDLVTNNMSTSAVSVFLNKGDGTFLPGTDYGTGSVPYSPVLGDFNGDGISDVAVVTSKGAQLLLGQGDGSLQPGIVVYATPSANSLASGDFNGDGLLDLAVVDQANSAVRILLNKGDGTFWHRVDLATGYYNGSLSAADLNGDGVPDLVLIYSYTSKLSVLLGKGDGSFSAAVDYAAGSDVRGVAIADYNGDSYPDIAVANYGYYSSSLVLLGKGDGSFTPKSGDSWGRYVNSIASGDYNADGLMDIAVGDSDYSGYGRVLVGFGDGTFQTSGSGNGCSYCQIFMGDLNADGITDVMTLSGYGYLNVSLGLEPTTMEIAGGSLQSAVVNSVFGRALQVRVTGAAGSPVPGVTVTFTAPSSGPGGTFPGGLKTEVKTDSQGLAIAPVFSANGLAGVYSVQASAGALSAAFSLKNLASFSSAVTLSSTPNPSVLGQTVNFTVAVTPGSATGTVSLHDGVQFLASGTLNAGQATFSSPLLSAGKHSLRAVYSGDFNFPPATSQVLAHTVSALPGSGFGAGTDYTLSALSAVQGDFNRDGYPDLAFTIKDNSYVGVLLGQAGGTFQAKKDYSVTYSGGSLATGDFNGDGIPDLATTGYSLLSVLLGNGDGTFQPALNSPLTSEPKIVGVADVDGNGLDDLVIYSNFALSFLPASGGGRFRPQVECIAGVSGGVIADFNGDGIADLAAFQSGNVVVLLGKGDGSFLAKAPYPLTANLQSMISGDFNSDGIADLVLNHDNMMSVLLGKGDGTFQPKIDSAASGNFLSLAMGDFNGDGRVDLIGAYYRNYNDYYLSILPGNADGSFQPNVDYPVNLLANFLLVGDFNRDGLTDVVLPGTSTSVSVLPGMPLGGIAAASGTPQTVLVGKVLARRLQALVTNSGGKPVPSVAVTFTAPSSGASGTFEGGGVTAQAITNGQGVATAPTFTANGTPGSYSMKAGIGAFSANFSLTNSAANNTLTLASTPNPSNLSQEVTLTATVSQGAATGRVVFYDGANPLGDAPLSGGKAVLKTSLLPGGKRLLQARYAGDAVYTPSASPKLAQVVNSKNVYGFGPAVSYGATSGVTLLAYADFNGDGRPDLAALRNNYNGGDVPLSVFLGDSDGTLHSGAELTVGANGLAAGDFNGDGIPDLVTVGRNSASVFLGKGDGTFQAKLDSPASTNTSQVAVGDFNSDGALDILVTVLDSSGLAVLLGRGDGTFFSQVALPPSGVGGLGIGDFNGDGIPDVAVAAQETLGVLLGKGDGTFQPKVDYPINYTASSLVVADFNGDGKLDLAVDCAFGGVSVLLGNGNGTFQAKADYEAGYDYSYSMSASDVNGDGILDLIVPYSELYVLLGNSNGTFQAKKSYGQLPGTHLVVADFNGDGIPDLALGSGTLRLSLGLAPTALAASAGSGQAALIGKTLARSLQARVTGPGGSPVPGVTVTFTAPTTGPKGTFAGGSSTAQAQTDAQGVATAPVFTAGAAAGTYSVQAAASGLSAAFSLRNVTAVTAAVTLAAGPSPSTFGQAVTLTAGVTPAPASGTITFFDGAQILGTAALKTGQAKLSTSLLAAGTHLLRAVFGGDANSVAVSSASLSQKVNGVAAAGFGTKTDYSGCSESSNLLVADLNGDGILDVVSGGVNSSGVCVMLGTAGGGFQSGTGYAYYSVVISDFNLDGVPDLAVTNNGAKVSVLRGKGDGTFLPPLETVTSGYPGQLATGDFNSDGIPDLAFINPDNSTVGVMLGNGDGTFQSTGALAGVSQPIWILTGDFNGDGRADLAVLGYYAGSMSILLGKGDGTFQAKIDVPLGLYSASRLKTGDFNGDGRTDLAIRGRDNQGGNLIRILLGKGDGSFPVQRDTVLHFNPSQMEVGDVDADGRLDLLLTGDYSNPGLRFLAGKGDGYFQEAITYQPDTGSAGMAIADLNGDGRADLLLGSSYSIGVVFGLAPTISLNIPGTTIPQAGSTGQVLVSANTAWTASSASAWIHVTSGSSGTGNGTVAYSVDANGGGSRTGKLLIGDKTFTISQTGLAAAVFRNTDNAIDLTRRGVAALDHAWGGFGGDPALTVDSGTGNFLAIGRTSYGALWANIFDAATQKWGKWSGGEGQIKGNPAVTAVGATAYIATRDKWDSYWLTSYSGGEKLGTWTPLGAVFSTDPAAASCPDGSVYLVGKDNWNALWSGHYVPGSGFQGWQFGGGIVQGKPSIACGSDNGLYIGVRDNWNGVWMTRLQGNTWGGWYFGGGVVSADPQVISGGGVIYTVVMDGAGAAYYRTFQEGTGNGWQDWGTIGGGFLDVAPVAMSGELYMAGRDPGNSLWWYRLAGNDWTPVGATGQAAGPLQTAR